MNVQVTPGHYFEGYDSRERFCSYWTQIEEILRVTGRAGLVLEIGKGNGLTSWYLQNAGFRVTTVDHDGALRPTVAADLRRLPFADASFQTVVAFQVLEHLPFEDFVPSVSELSRVASDHVILSLPNCSGSVTVSASLPRIGGVRKIWSIPRPRKDVFVKGQHCWEIGVRGYPVGRIRSGFASAGLVETREFRLVEFPFHHFFVLAKREA